MTNGGGGSPPSSLVQNGGEATDLITTAQVTPVHQQRVREARRRALRRPRPYGVYDVRQVLAMARSALDRGYKQTGLMSGEWNLAPTCHNPRPVIFDGAPRVLHGGRYVRSEGRPYSLTLLTRCRRCDDCLRKRRNLWAYRAQEEIRAWPRTWFATFTLAPDWHLVMRMRASVRLREGGTDFESLPLADQLYELSAEYRREVTLYLKRLRKQTGAILRYLLVQEQHKSGLPHFHALIHEVNPDLPLRHAALTSQWKLGYTKFKLCEGVKTAWYVAKYLSKAVDNRVRASIGYGFSKTILNRSGTKSPRETNSPAKPESKEGLWRQSSDDVKLNAVEQSDVVTENLHALRRFLRQVEAGHAGPSAEVEAASSDPVRARQRAAREAFAATHSAIAALKQAFREGSVWDCRPDKPKPRRLWNASARPVAPLVPSEPGGGLCVELRSDVDARIRAWLCRDARRCSA